MAISPPTRGERAEPRIDPNLDPETDSPSFGDRADFGRTPARRRNPITWLLLLMVVVAGAAFYYLWQQNAVQPSPVTPPALQASAATEAAPAIRHPIEEARGTAPAADSKPLPALMVSDTTMQNLLADLFGPASLGKVFYQDAIIHRFVTTVDNLPRKSVSSRNMPVKPIPGALLASATDDHAAISDENAARYRPYVQMAEAIDARNLVDAYVQFYPLMQQDYRDLGYPKAYFNDRLIEAIDDLLGAPEATDPVQVAQPKILYQYADPDLEARSAGQKIMIRMGGDNAARMKAKLREIRAALTGPKGADPSVTKVTQ